MYIIIIIIIAHSVYYERDSPEYGITNLYPTLDNINCLVLCRVTQYMDITLQIFTFSKAS